MRISRSDAGIYEPTVTPLTSWSAFQPDRPESDFRDLPAGDVLMKVALHQIDTLTEICKRCAEDPEHAAEVQA